jgi:hypothetical protein
VLEGWRGQGRNLMWISGIIDILHHAIHLAYFDFTLLLKLFVFSEYLSVISGQVAMQGLLKKFFCNKMMFQ